MYIILIKSVVLFVYILCLHETLNSPYMQMNYYVHVNSTTADIVHPTSSSEPGIRFHNQYLLFFWEMYLLFFFVSVSYAL